MKLAAFTIFVFSTLGIALSDDLPQNTTPAPNRQAAQPLPVLPTLIKPDTQEQMQLEIISLQQEILRLSICLKRNLTMEECGAWRNGQVMQMPKAGSKTESKTVVKDSK